MAFAVGGMLIQRLSWRSIGEIRSVPMVLVHDQLNDEEFEWWPAAQP